MTPTEKLKATMAALGISADGLEFEEHKYFVAVGGNSEGLLLRHDRLLYRAIQIARLFGRER